MKNSTLFLAAALASTLITLPAWATVKPTQPGNTSSSSSASSNASSNSNSSAGAIGVGIGGAGGSSSAAAQGGQASAQGGSVSVRTGSPTLRAEQSLNLSINHQAQERNPVASAFAPSINPTTLCVSPIVGGIQLPGFGISGGSVFEGDTCDTIEQAKTTVHTFGDQKTGEELMCGLKKYRDARKAVNRPCLADTPHAGASFTGVCLDPSGQPYADPLVAARACPVK